MELGNTVIVGQGLLGREIELSVRKQECIVTILKKVTSEQKNLIPKNTENVIIVAQSPDYRKDFITPDLFYVNTALPIQLAQQAVEVGVKRFAYCSTGSVYTNSK